MKIVLYKGKRDLLLNIQISNEMILVEVYVHVYVILRILFIVEDFVWNKQVLVFLSVFGK